MIAVYLSGTGNTKHCLELLLQTMQEPCEMIPMGDEKASEKVLEQDMVILAYPTQFSNLPFMVRSFIKENAAGWRGTKVFCLSTMGLFSGDATGCAARLLHKYGARVIGGLQVRMPDSVCDQKALKKTEAENRKIIQEAEAKIIRAAAGMKQGRYPREGLSVFAHMAGLFGQRLWFLSKTKDYSKKLKISDACIGCGVCAKACPMKNLTIENGRAKAQGKCTMCYSCISRCPRQAITLLGKRVVDQYRFEKYCS